MFSRLRYVIEITVSTNRIENGVDLVIGESAERVVVCDAVDHSVGKYRNYCRLLYHRSLKIKGLR